MQQRNHGLLNDEHGEPADANAAAARASGLVLMIERIRPF